jgi:putative copper resistance protein D
MLIILLVMPIDTFTGIALLMTKTAPWPAYAAQHHTWGPSPLSDVHSGGAVMWIGGDTIMIILIISAMFPWLAGRAHTGIRLRWVEQARRANLDRYLAAVPGAANNPGTANAIERDVDEDQVRLDAYNAWLAQMSTRGTGRE